MTLDVTFVVVGLAVLTWSANRFVDGAAALATNLGLAPLIVGIVVMGFGTSAPELLISSLAAAQGNPGLSIGNALGSNISNIALILGTVALIAPLAIHGRTIRRALPVLLLAMPPGLSAERLVLGGDDFDWPDNSLIYNALDVTEDGTLTPLEADTTENPDEAEIDDAEIVEEPKPEETEK